MLPGLISEIDASNMAGVSARTLSRFAEAGYLQVENSSDGLRFYSKNEVLELFGIRDQNFYDKLAEDLSEAAKPQSETGILRSASREFISNETTSNLKVERYDSTPTPSTISTAELSPGLALSSREAEELAKLRSLVALQEKLLDVNEERIKSLSQEREWLRNRYEKLEQKSERDQLLILSESQTVRRLVIMNNERKSPLRAALEWLGLVTPGSSVSDLKSTIESNAGKNENN